MTVNLHRPRGPCVAARFTGRFALGADASPAGGARPLGTHYPGRWEDIIVGGRMKIEGGCAPLPKGAGLGVELARAALARAHENCRRCGITERPDALEMPIQAPGWKFTVPRR